jgi:hypothetical protein
VTEHGRERRAKVRVAKLEPGLEQLARHAPLPAEQRLRAFTEQCLERESGRFERRGPMEPLTDQAAQLGVRDGVGGTQVHWTAQRRVVDAAEQRRDLVIEVDPREALTAAADRPADE